MSFTADKQTLEDLNLLGKYKQNSVFSLFNKVHTKGGEKLLMDMFQHPLSDAEEINKRSAIFKYFQEKDLIFPFSNDQFSITADYLGGSISTNYLGVLGNLIWKKVLGNIVRDGEYQNTKINLQCAVVVLKTCKEFLDNFENESTYNPYRDRILLLHSLFGDERLLRIQNEHGTENWSILKVVKYDYLFRNVLRAELKILIDIFQEFDLFIAVSNLSRSRGFSYADALPKENNVFSAAKLWHPCIDKAIDNPVSLNHENNLIFLTGANMAGKSTFMKAFGIAIYLAHMGFPVAAGEMVFSVKEGIWSSINVPDNLSLGLSHFYAEVLRVKTVAKAVSSSKNLVVIFDELFKGTNVKDAYDATLAVTAAFATYSNCLFIISTHIVEVGSPLQRQKNNIQFRYLPTTMTGNIPSYTYQLEEGISGDRHGMMIIENEGILNIIQNTLTI